MLGATTGAVPARRPALLGGGAVTLVLLVAGVVLAAPALAAPATGEPTETTGTTSAALVDPARPTARVVHGPNCTDGFVRVQVTNGDVDHTVALQYDGADTGSPATLAAGEQTTLEGAEVDWGTVVDVTVAVTGAGGAEPAVDLGTYPRPSQADCDAVTAPTGTTSPTAVPPSTSGPTSQPTTPPTAPTTTTPRPTTSAPTTTPGTRPSTSPTGAPTATAPPATTGTTTQPPVDGSTSTGQVSPGSVLTIRGSGFAPGEQVTVTLDGSATPLATVTADGEGRVEAVVQIPQDVLLGPAVVRMVGTDSAAATEVSLDVAARAETDPAGRTPWPLMAAGLGLLVVATTLATAAARRPRADDWEPPTGQAGAAG
ncbi:hypothetical protein SAMN05660199_02662 [Klenkia soli]|uniref:IPT/TIG domain-containing protein n=1 Tax=Klenkia soli TaxID=1052260 RepID=A0A1H0MWL0_9ACTN|nr:hypothetical protein [Klenkia soli]SDO84858.1 hypothetical protein SAMN05660199_02662 [Klenkia soli]